MPPNKFTPALQKVYSITPTEFKKSAYLDR